MKKVTAFRTFDGKLFDSRPSAAQHLERLHEELLSRLCIALFRDDGDHPRELITKHLDTLALLKGVSDELDEELYKPRMKGEM